MKNKFILSALFSGLMIIGVQAQEKKVRVSDSAIKTEQKAAPAVKKADKPLANPEANVNFEENISDVTLGQSEIVKKSLNYDGMVVGENRPSIPITLEEPTQLHIMFKADNANALYYLTDRLENIVIPARETEFNDRLPAGQYFLVVGLTPEEAKNQGKATYSFVVTK